MPFGARGASPTPRQWSSRSRRPWTTPTGSTRTRESNPNLNPNSNPNVLQQTRVCVLVNRYSSQWKAGEASTVGIKTARYFLISKRVSDGAVVFWYKPNTAHATLYPVARNAANEPIVEQFQGQERRVLPCPSERGRSAPRSPDAWRACHISGTLPTHVASRSSTRSRAQERRQPRWRHSACTRTRPRTSTSARRCWPSRSLFKLIRHPSRQARRCAYVRGCVRWCVPDA